MGEAVDGGDVPKANRGLETQATLPDSPFLKSLLTCVTKAFLKLLLIYFGSKFMRVREDYDVLRSQSFVSANVTPEISPFYLYL